MRDHEYFVGAAMGWARRLRNMDFSLGHANGVPVREDISLGTVLMLLVTMVAGALFSIGGLAMIEKLLAQGGMA